MSSFDDNKKAITEPQRPAQKKWLDVPLPALTPSGDTPQPKRALFNIPQKPDIMKDSSASLPATDIKKSWKDAAKNVCLSEQNRTDTKPKDRGPQK